MSKAEKGGAISIRLAAGLLEAGGVPLPEFAPDITLWEKLDKKRLKTALEHEEE